MAASKIELRVAALEAEVAHLKEQVEKSASTKRDWLDAIYGAFANDPHFEEAMQLGREYRESLHPKPRSRRVKPPQITKARKAEFFG